MMNAGERGDLLTGTDVRVATEGWYTVLSVDGTTYTVWTELRPWRPVRTVVELGPPEEIGPQVYRCWGRSHLRAVRGLLRRLQRAEPA